MKRAIPIVIGLVIVAAFAGTLVFLYNKSEADPVVYKTEGPKTLDIVNKTVATGAIVPRKEIEIKPRVSGILQKLDVEPGQRVSAGDVVATIQIVPNMVSLNSAEANLKAAQINFENAKKELARFNDLFAQNVVSETEHNRYQLDFKLRQQELDAAQSNLQLIKSGASRKSGKVSNIVKATVAGMVIDVPVKEGASVTETNNFNPGTTIAIIADMGDMIFEGTVNESEVGKIKEGMPLDVTIGAIEKQRFSGNLEYIAPKGVQIEGAIQFEIRAAMKLVEGTFIRAGYSANADIVLDRRDQVLAINESLLQFGDDKEPFVEVQTAPQQFERRPVELGLSDGIHVEVLSGVSEGDAIKKPE